MLTSGQLALSWLADRRQLGSQQRAQNLELQGGSCVHTLPHHEFFLIAVAVAATRLVAAADLPVPADGYRDQHRS